MSEEQPAGMTLVEHLQELKVRMIRAVIAVILGFFVAYAFHIEIFEFIATPIRDALAERGIYRLMAIEVTETIFVYLKASVVAALVLTGPYVIYQFWAFIAPGLLPHEKRFVAPVAFFSALFFLLGTAFAYNVLLPFITGFLADMAVAGGSVDLKVTVSSTFSFTFMALLAFGIIFQLPIVMLFLALFGLTTHHSYLKFFRYFIVLSFIVGAFFTPPEPVSQAMMAVPMIGLYGVGIVAAWIVGQSRKKSAEDDEQPNSSMGLRVWFGVAGALIAVAVGIVALVQLLSPGPKPIDAIPTASAFAIGVDPVRVESPEALRRASQFALGHTEAAKSLESRLADGDVAYVVLFEMEGGERGALLQPAEDVDPDTLEATSLAKGLYGVGHPDALDAAESSIGTDEEALVGTMAGRSLKALRTSGPAWAYANSAFAPWLELIPLHEEIQEPEAVGWLLESVQPNVLTARVWVGAPERASAFRSRLSSWRQARDLERAQREERAQAKGDLRKMAEMVVRLADSVDATLSAQALQTTEAVRDPQAWEKATTAARTELDAAKAELASLLAPLRSAERQKSDANAQTDATSGLFSVIPQQRIRDWKLRSAGSEVDLVLTLDSGGLEALFERSRADTAPETTAHSSETDAKRRRQSAESEVVQ